MPLLEISGLTKHFGGLRAVHDLVLHVGNDEIVGLIGPNGSGKTTVFNLVTGLYPATAGRVVFDHGRQELTGLPPHCIRARGITVLLIEHDMTVIRGICDRVVALDHGTKIAEGRFEEVRESAAVLEAYLGRRAGRA